MSNAAVGLVYDTIIAEVINAVRVDFEENGVDDGALEDLKKVRFYRSPFLSTSRPLPLAAFPPPCFAISNLSIKPGSFPQLIVGCGLPTHILLVWRWFRWSKRRDKCRLHSGGRLRLLGREGVESSRSGWATQYFWVSF